MRGFGIPDAFGVLADITKTANERVAKFKASAFNSIKQYRHILSSSDSTTGPLSPAQTQAALRLLDQASSSLSILGQSILKKGKYPIED